MWTASTGRRKNSKEETNFSWMFISPPLVYLSLGETIGQGQLLQLVAHQMPWER